MSAFQVSKQIVVDANRCRTDNTIQTESGYRTVKPGEWIVRSENGSCYIVDDQFFKTIFAPVAGGNVSAGSPTLPKLKRERHYGA